MANTLRGTLCPWTASSGCWPQSSQSTSLCPSWGPMGREQVPFTARGRLLSSCLCSTFLNISLPTKWAVTTLLLTTPPFVFICLQSHSINLPLASSWMSDEEQPFLVFVTKFNPCFLCSVFLNQPCPSISIFPSCNLSPTVSMVPVKSWFASVLSIQILPVYFLYFWHDFWRN